MGPCPSPSRWRPCAVSGLMLLAALVGLRQQLSAAPPVIVAAAIIPPVCFAAIVWRLGYRESGSWMPSLAAFLWGGTVAPSIALALNDAALRAHSQGLVTAVAGPLAEELAKGGALVLVMFAWPGSLRRMREGIVYGALAGLGFAATENVGYYVIAAVQSGGIGLARAVYVRGFLEGLNHATFTAVIGAAAGQARSRPAPWLPRVGILLAGFFMAVAAHGAWNVLASPAITTLLCNAAAEGAACGPGPRLVDLVVSIPVIITASVGPLAVLVVVLALRNRPS